MALEIERKFLVKDQTFRAMAQSEIKMCQGYLSRTPEATVRVRICNDKACITVKGKNRGMVRNEWEYEIPLSDAKEMLELCDGNINKTRYIVPYHGFNWEVDEFHGRHEGLIVAEVELPSKDTDPDLPGFIGEEVTGNPAYYNSNL